MSANENGTTENAVEVKAPQDVLRDALASAIHSEVMTALRDSDVLEGITDHVASEIRDSGDFAENDHEHDEIGEMVSQRDFEAHDHDGEFAREDHDHEDEIEEAVENAVGDIEYRMESIHTRLAKLEAVKPSLETGILQPDVMTASLQEAHKRIAALEAKLERMNSTVMMRQALAEIMTDILGGK